MVVVSSFGVLVSTRLATVVDAEVVIAELGFEASEAVVVGVVVVDTLEQFFGPEVKSIGSASKIASFGTKWHNLPMRSKEKNWQPSVLEQCS